MKIVFCLSKILLAITLIIFISICHAEVPDVKASDKDIKKTDYKPYTILEIEQKGGAYEIIASDSEQKNYKIISQINASQQWNLPQIEIGKTYMIRLESVEDLLGIPHIMPSYDIIYHFGEERHQTELSKGILTIHYTHDLDALYYIPVNISEKDKQEASN